MLSRWLGRWRYGAPVVVVSGLPRSGTSMLMQMLAAGGIPAWTDAIRAADEDNPKGYLELERVKELDQSTDKAWVKDARGKAIKVISMLLEHLPPSCAYKIVFLRRALDEVITSQNKMLVRAGRTPDLEAEKELRQYYERHLKKLAIQLRSRPNMEVLYLDHRAVLDDPATAAGQIAAFLGRPLDVAKMARAVDKQLYRNREPSDQAVAL